ncbi:S8 family serine peptidase [Nocardioides sp. MAHUQ-72]|uniref:S8 family serine peptidase n=1 Tax=unclassified Nocardioides TaxID=2615069 RepID=UPI00360C252A
MRLSVAASGAVTGLALAGLLVPAVPAQADVDAACLGSQTDTPRTDTENTSVPLEALGAEQAQELFGDRAPGSGVTVAVLDSGVVDSPLLTVRSHQSFGTATKGLVSGHGSVVAGLVAGHARANGKPVGVAPGASIIDVRVYDTDLPQDGAQPPQTKVSTSALVDGLEWVAGHARAEGIKVANISLATAHTPELERAVEKAWDAGVVVVAAAGNRPGEGQLNYETLGTFRTGEDAHDLVAPARYEHVVAVTATPDGDPEHPAPTTYVVQNSATDVAAPTYGGVSIDLNGSTCVVQEVATSWATAEVSGVLALLWSRYPTEKPAQIVARLLDTADGSALDPTPLRGAGVVQPVEALTRPLHPDRAGDLPRARPEEGRTPRATSPEPEADVLAATREHAVWWGLLGGGALLLALLLRPVTARRRT